MLTLFLKMLCFNLIHIVGIYMKESLHKIITFSSEIGLVMRTTSLNLQRAESFIVRCIVN